MPAQGSLFDVRNGGGPRIATRPKPERQMLRALVSIPTKVDYGMDYGTAIKAPNDRHSMFRTIVTLRPEFPDSNDK